MGKVKSGFHQADSPESEPLKITLLLTISLGFHSTLLYYNSMETGSATLGIISNFYLQVGKNPRIMITL